MADDAINSVNGVEYTKDEWIAGYKRDQEVFDDIQQNNLNITTMYYNNGRIFTNHWLTWYGKSKITGESKNVEYYGYWEWKDRKICFGLENRSIENALGNIDSFRRRLCFGIRVWCERA